MASKIKVDTLETANGSGSITLNNPIASFTSTGIDDNATSTKVTVSNTGVDVTGRATTDGITSSGSIIFDNGGSSVGIHSDSSDGSYIAYGANEYLRFLYDAGGGETMRMHDSGYVTMPQGVTLGNGNTYAAANTLSDYETGTWTPSFGGSTSNPTVNFNVAGGTYVKVGSLVTIGVSTTTVSVSGGSGGLFLNGLPFNKSSGASYGAVAAQTQNFNTLPSEPLRGYVVSDYVRFKYGNAVDVPTSVLRTSGDSNQIWMSFTYHTDS